MVHHVVYHVTGNVVVSGAGELVDSEKTTVDLVWNMVMELRK